MKNIFKTILGAVLGILISMFVIMLFDSLNAKLYPSSERNPTMKDFISGIQNLPIGAFVLIFTGYTLSSFFGGYTAARIAPNGKKVLASFCVGFFLLLGGIVYFISIPHPWILSISTSISFLVFSYLGGRLASKY